jgi:RND family efflux transporter MFP subunit
MNLRLPILYVSLLLPGILITACSHQAEVIPAATPVHTVMVKTGPAAPDVVTTGVVTAADEAKLSFKVGGVIQRIAVRVGEQVKAGQMLAELIPTEINASQSQAQQLSDKAQRDVERGERLYADQVIALSQLEDLRTQAKVAAAQLQAATFNQGYARIVAPGAGTVLRKLAEEHELVAPGQPIMTLGARDTGYVVRAALSDRDAVQLKVGDTATIKLDAYPDKTFTGRISEIGGAAQVENGLFPVEVKVQTDEILANGLVAQLGIQPQLATRQSLVYVPTGAVVSGVGQRASIFVLDNAVARRREVTVAFFMRDQVAIATGVQPGEQVITDGALYLSDGEKVSVHAAATSSTTQVAGSQP